jgi:hypothetical protein
MAIDNMYSYIGDTTLAYAISMPEQRARLP